MKALAASIVAAAAGQVAGQTGPCCLPDSTCQTLTLSACTAVNGLYFGSGSSCDHNLCGRAFSMAGAPVAIPDGSAAGCGETIVSVEVTGGLLIYNVEASFYIQHPNQGDLEITLDRGVGGVGGSVLLVDRPGWPATPTGFTSHDYGASASNTGLFISTMRVANRYDAPVTPVDNPAGRWRLEGSIPFYGMSADGAWSLRVRDCAAGGVGSIVAFNLHLNVVSVSAGTCYPNCDNSTIAPCLNVNDFVCFLNAFTAGEHYANCDSGVVYPYFNANDFVCYMSWYNTQCGSGGNCLPRP